MVNFGRLTKAQVRALQVHVCLDARTMITVRVAERLRYLHFKPILANFVVARLIHSGPPVASSSMDQGEDPWDGQWTDHRDSFGQGRQVGKGCSCSLKSLVHLR